MGNSGYLSSCDRDLGAPIEFQQESQASSCLVAWNSTFLLSCKRGVRPPVELRQGTRAFSRGATGESDLPSCCEGKLEVSFKSLQGIQALSQVEGELCGFSTCGRNLGVPFELQWVRQASSREPRGKSGFLSSGSRGIGPHLEMR